MPHFLRTLSICAVAATLAAVAPANAAPATAADRVLALTMAKAAKDALKGGKHGLAAQMFAEALKLDPTQADYLYGLARAQHLSGLKAAAERSYRRFLTETKGHRAEAKVRRLLADLIGERAELARTRKEQGRALALYDEASVLDPSNPSWVTRVGKVAAAAAAAGEYSVALKACALLLRLEPKVVEHRLRQARIYRMKGDLELAQRRYLEVLSASPLSPAGVAAKAELSEVVADRAGRVRSVVRVATPAPRRASVGAVAAQRSGSASGQWRRPAGWTAAVIGAATLVAGGVVAGMASGDYDGLVGRLKNGDSNGDGRVDVMTRSAAQAELEGINGRKRVGAVLLGVGGVAAAAGIWLLLRGPSGGESTAMLSPFGRGMALRVMW